MSRTALALALAGAFFAAPAQAFFEANVAAGYTTLAMGDINSAIDKSGGEAKTTVNSGFYLSADAGLSVAPFVKLAPRVSLVQASQGKFKTGASETTVDGYLVPLALGLATDLSLPMSGISARAGLWGGYGMATVGTGTKTNGVLTNSNLLQGSAFTAEALAALRYGVLPFLSLSLEAGYRLANVGTLKDGAGKEWKDAADKPIGADFSGANIGGGLVFSF